MAASSIPFFTKIAIVFFSFFPKIEKVFKAEIPKIEKVFIPYSIALGWAGNIVALLNSPKSQT
ncbi:MAG: hypothetical protein LUF35_13025 [Lachnospiraceae bacterium]|nr:hypothetical protein [Lachnospiraceae bacterium]